MSHKDYNTNQIKTNVVAGYNYCKKVYNGGIESPEQFDAFVNLCQNYLDICNTYCTHIKPTFGILQYKQYKDYHSVRNICIDTIDEINGILTGLQILFDKQREETEAFTQLESRMRFEAAVAYDIKESERKQTFENARKRPIGFIINKNKDNIDE